MSGLPKVVVLSLAATLACAGAALAQSPVHLPGVGAAEKAATKSMQKHVAVTHGTWMQGPGTYAVTVCDSGCTINGAPGTTINLAIAMWGAGGGGGGGRPTPLNWYGTPGGGGGGGGGYHSASTTVVVPASGTTKTYQVVVGTGGAPSYSGGTAGGASEVRVGGQIVVGVTGGRGGGVGNSSGGAGGAGGAASFGGQSGITVSHSGSVGAAVGTCNGGAGGNGGAGSGPGAINHGGNGGHGGYYHDIPQCTSKGSMFGLSPGTAGAHGRVTIVW